MATTYSNIQMSVVDASGNVNVIYPQTLASLVTTNPSTTGLSSASTTVEKALTELNSNLDIFSNHYIGIGPEVVCETLKDLCKEITKRAKESMFYGSAYLNGYYAFFGFTYQTQTEVPNYAQIKFLGLQGVERTLYTYRSDDWIELN